MNRRIPFQKPAMAALDSLGLGDALRRAKHAFLTYRHGGWIPLVPEREFTACARRAIAALKAAGETEFGDYLEFGVSRGTSLACMHAALEAEGLDTVRLIGFDSFEGMPPESVNEGWLPGQFRSTIQETRDYLTGRGVDWSRTHLVQGWFDQTLTDATRDSLGLEKASLIMVDCDIHSASRDALFFAGPLIGKRAVILFDDWGPREDAGEIGQKEAFDEFLAAFPALSARPLESYSEAARAFIVERQDA